MGMLPLLLAAAVLGIVCLAFLRKHFVVAIGGLLVLAGLLAWQTVVLIRVSRIYDYAGTRASMEEIGLSLRDYRREHGPFPKGMTLADLTPGLARKDWWGRPFDLLTQEDAFVLTSWGRDGIKGGTGFDRDLICQWKLGSPAPTIDAADYSP